VATAIGTSDPQKKIVCATNRPGSAAPASIVARQARGAIRRTTSGALIRATSGTFNQSGPAW
jgi:hypothetical protein